MAHKVGMEDTQRRLTLCLSTLSLIFNAVSVFLLQKLPDDPFHLSWAFSLYSGFSVLLGFIGLAGAVWRNSSCANLFSVYLFTSAIISVIPRVLILTILSSLFGNLCSVSITSPSSFAPDNTSVLADLSSPEHIWMRIEDATWTTEHCQTFVQALRSVGGLMLLAMAFVQLWCATRVGEYATRLARIELAVQSPKVPPEKSHFKSLSGNQALIEKMIKDW